MCNSFDPVQVAGLKQRKRELSFDTTRALSAAAIQNSPEPGVSIYARSQFNDAPALVRSLRQKHGALYGRLNFRGNLIPRDQTYACDQSCIVETTLRLLIDFTAFADESRNVEVVSFDGRFYGLSHGGQRRMLACRSCNHAGG